MPALEPAVLPPLRRWAPDYLGQGPCGDGAFVHAHVTVLSPWLELGRMPGADVDAAFASLGSALGDTPPFDATFRRTGRFDDSGLTYVAPEPVEAFLQLTGRVVQAWPDHRPYGGVHGDVRPHLSVDHTRTAREHASLSARLAPLLPARQTVTEVHAHWYEPRRTRCLGRVGLSDGR